MQTTSEQTVKKTCNGQCENCMAKRAAELAQLAVQQTAKEPSESR